MSSTGGLVAPSYSVLCCRLRRPELSIRGKSQKPSMSSSLAVGAAFPTVSFSSDEEDGAGVGGDSMWLQLELRCSLTLQRLTDPARGDACLHPPKCNYEVHTPLREPASLCPGATLPMQM